MRKISLQKEAKHLLRSRRVRLIPDGQIEPRLFVHNALFVAEGVEPFLAVIRAHSARPDAAEAHFARGKVNDGVIDASSAEPAACHHRFCKRNAPENIHGKRMIDVYKRQGLVSV